jgi:hypothetical protein
MAETQALLRPDRERSTAGHHAALVTGHDFRGKPVQVVQVPANEEVEADAIHLGLVGPDQDLPTVGAAKEPGVANDLIEHPVWVRDAVTIRGTAAGAGAVVRLVVLRLERRRRVNSMRSERLSRDCLGE